MDHLPLPRNPVQRHLTVPYVCTTAYDGGDFLTYPDRAGDKWKVFLRRQAILFYHEQHTPSDDLKLAGFLQTWLFFGLLYELLNPWQLYAAEDYIQDDEVHTRCLNARLESWREKCNDLDDEAKVMLEQRLYECMELTRKALYATRPEAHPKFDARIRWSLTILYDTIHSLGSLALKGIWRVAISKDMLNKFCEEDVSIMKANGWCSSLIEFKSSAQISNPLRWYMSHLQLADGLDHNACQNICQYEQIQNVDYQPHHVAQCDGCPNVRPDLERISDILRSGTFPVLEVVDDGTAVRIEVLPYIEGQTAYVALSHVWAEGLGNPKELALPACQLKRLRSLVDRVNPAVKHYIWCDTLLCPMDSDESTTTEEIGSIKQQAMSLMRQVYQKSSSTLVLCKALECVSSQGMDSIEMAVRLLNNNWRQRLWTCQEAALPTDLRYQFSDRAVSHTGIHSQIKSSLIASPALRSLCWELDMQLIELRVSLHNKAVKESMLSMLPSFLGLRRCSYPEDESLCAGALLGLDVGAIWKGKDVQERMMIFWRECSKVLDIPQNIVFNLGDRIERPGFNWAPTNFKMDSVLQVTPGEERSAVLMERGLQVHMPAYKIEPAILPFISPQPYRQMVKNMTSSMTMHGPHGWYELSLTWPIAEDQFQQWCNFLNNRQLDWHLLIEDDLVDELGSQGVLGYMEEGVLHSYLVLTVRKLGASRTALQDTSCNVARYLRWLNRSFVRCWLIVTLAERAFVPLMRGSRLLWSWMVVSVILLRHHVRYFLREVIRLSKAPASPRLRSLLEDQGSIMGIGIVHAHAHRIFYGHYAKIKHTYDRDTVWCVD